MLPATSLELIDQVVPNPDGFYPDLNLQDWQELYRVPGDAPQSLERLLLLAMQDSNRHLASWKAELLADAVAAGDPVPTELPATYRTDYEEGVYAQATALLIPLLPSIVTDERAREEMALLHQTPGHYHDRSEARLGRITGTALGRGRIKAAVI